LLRERSAIGRRIGSVTHNGVVACVDKAAAEAERVTVAGNHASGDTTRAVAATVIPIELPTIVLSLTEMSVALVLWVALIPDDAALNPM
jgi:hypothetical protein